MRHIVGVLFIMLFISSCGGHNAKLSRSFDDFLGQTIVIPRLDEAICICNGRDTIVPISTESHNGRIVIYYDSSTCSSCEISELWRWKFFTDEIRQYDIDMLFIFAPSEAKEDEVITYLNLYHLPWPVYIDTDNLFSRNNKSLPHEKLFHTFLLDRKNRVVLIGDPIKSYEMQKLYKNVIEKFRDS